MVRTRQPEPLAVTSLDDRISPAVTRILAVGSAVGAPAVVTVLDHATDQVRFTLDLYRGFTGGVRVAVGDVSGDGVVDVVTAPGPGGESHVRVFDGRTGEALAAPTGNFLAFEAGFTGGVEVAAGDLNADGYDDIIVGAGLGGGPRVRALSGKDGTVLADLFTYAQEFRGGAMVAAGDLNGDGRADLITGPGVGGGPHVRAISGATGKELVNRFAFAEEFRGGLSVAAADTDGDGAAELVVGAGPGGGPAVRLFDGVTGADRGGFFAGDPADRAGVRLTAGDTGGDGRVEVMTGAGGVLSTFKADTGERIDQQLVAGEFCVCPAVPEADAVVSWNRAVLQAVREARLNPPVTSRLLAITHLAMFDAANVVTGGYQPYLNGLPAAPAGVQPEAAAAGAAYQVLSKLLPAQQARWDRLLAADALVAATARSASEGFGRAVGDAYLAARGGDGSATATPYTPGAEPGDWVPTPPANAAALLPGWGKVTPFAVASAGQFAPPAPPSLGSAEYAAAVAEVRALGSKAGSTRNADQTQIALFWADGAGSVTPPGHWNLIAAGLCQTDGRDVTAHARTFALLNAALADAAITAWAAKYRDNLWRPVTAIRQADADGNPATAADPAWEPLITTPNFPSYTSGHSTFSGAAAAVLTAEYGSTPLRTPTDALTDASRAFPDFAAAAAEAGQSRIYGGIHYQFDNTAGLLSGRAVGAHVVGEILKKRG